MKIIQVALLLLLAVVGGSNVVYAFAPAQHQLTASSSSILRSTTKQPHSLITRFAAEDEEPSDVNPETDPADDVMTPSMEDAADDKDKKSDNFEPDDEDGGGWFSKPKTLQKLLELSARTGRGEFASKEERTTALDLVAALEGDKTSLQGVAYDPKIYGRWELVYSSTELFRSSPFFMAGRAVCTTEEQAQQYNWFCEMHRKALAISTIGTVRQIISPSRLISEFEVKAGTIPFLRKFTPFSYSGGLPIVIEGAIVSSADIDTTDEGDAWKVSMDTVEIKGSNLPGVRQFLDSGMKLESRRLGSFLESNLPNYSNPTPILETTYLDERIRISRDQDNNVFVYSKASDVMEPTDYSSVMPDLGVTRLLEGFNDSVTKIYL